MKEPHGEGVASHPGPESCGVTREGGAEALTGGSAGRAIEPRIRLPRCRRRWVRRKAIPEGAISQVSEGPGAVIEPQHARTLHAQELGDPNHLSGRE